MRTKSRFKSTKGSEGSGGKACVRKNRKARQDVRRGGGGRR